MMYNLQTSYSYIPPWQRTLIQSRHAICDGVMTVVSILKKKTQEEQVQYLVHTSQLHQLLWGVVTRNWHPLS